MRARGLERILMLRSQCLVIRATRSPTREPSMPMVCLDRAGSAPPAARTAQRPPSSPIRPIPRPCNISASGIGFYTHSGIAALATTLRAVPVASRSVKPALVGLRVAHALSAIPSPMPLPMRACPSSVCPGSVSGSCCQRRRFFGVPAAHERSASAVAVRGSSTLSSPAARVGWTPARRVSRDPAAPYPIPPTRLVPVDAEAYHRGLDGGSGAVLFVDISTAAAPRQHRSAPSGAGREASFAQPDRLPAASVSIINRPVLDRGLVRVLPQVLALGDERRRSNCRLRQRASRVAIGTQKQLTMPAACEGSISCSTGPTVPTTKSPCHCTVPPAPLSPHQPLRGHAARRRDPARWGSVMRPAGLTANASRKTGDVA
ncbi:hypothetical protein AURDEDRAFT_173522 [Auricularia subglabra TFB-10046 SS5]|nr:hypothetical protein AURDEDRAFT_173522 [Auricularia subglabra TFB-10046 SS5]